MSRTVLVALTSSVITGSGILLVLGVSGVLAFPSLGELTGIKSDVVNQLTSPLTDKIQLKFLPTGPGSGIDADFLDSLHATSFALKSSFEDFKDQTTKEIETVKQKAASIDFSPYLKKVEQAADSINLGGQFASFYQNASNLLSETLSDLRLSANVALLNASQSFTTLKTFSAGLTVNGGTLTLPTGSITSSSITDSTISGVDLASNISISTTGNLTTTGSGLMTSAGLLTASNGFTLSAGTLTLPSSSVSDAALSSNVALLTGSQTFTGAKTFSAAITAPTSSNTINGLVINSGDVTAVNLTSTSGSLTSTVADGASAVAFTLATSTTYSTSGAKVLSIKNNASELAYLDKNGLLNVNGNIVSTGTVSGTQLTSTVATGTAPLVISSTTQVANLNVSLLGGVGLSGLQVDRQVFVSSGIWTKPTGAKFVRVIVIGGGGSGGGGGQAGAGLTREGAGGGGGGAFVIRDFDASTLGTTETVTVGAQVSGAAGGSSGGGSHGTDGNNSSFGSHVTAYGGGGGQAGAGASTGGGGGGGGSAAKGGNGAGAAWGAGANGGNPGGGTGGAAGSNGASTTAFGGAGGGGSSGGGGAAVFGGAGGGGASNAANHASPGGQSLFGAGGGGAGGMGYSNDVTYYASAGGGTTNGYTVGVPSGGNGGGAPGANGGGAGGVGVDRSGTGKAGDGGGGGGANFGGTGGGGGAGTAPGGGGGGGGGGTSTGGAGGAGARGEVIVIVWF